MNDTKTFEFFEYKEIHSQLLCEMLLSSTGI